MKKIIPLVISVLLFSSCASARLSKGPDIFALPVHEGAVQTGVPKVGDLRDSEKIGSVGALVLKVKKEDLSGMMTNHLVNHLNTKMSINVIGIPDVTTETIPTMSKEKKLDGVVELKVTKIKLFSIDAVMQPVSTEISIRAAVYNASGKMLYEGDQAGFYEKHEPFMTDKKAGDMVEQATIMAFDRLVTDPDFENAIKQLSSKDTAVAKA